MSHEVETMAYAHDAKKGTAPGFNGEHTVPWHGLGEKVSQYVTCEEMLVAAGLDWTVHQMPLFFRDDAGESHGVDRVALVRDTDKKVLTVTSPNWKPLQNKDTLEFFKKYVEAGDATLETAGSLRGGKVVWALANLKTGFNVRGGKDRVDGYMLLTSPHEVGNAISLRATTVRVVCANTLAMAMGNGRETYRQSHVKEFDFDAAHATIEAAREEIHRASIDADTLAKMRMSQKDGVRLLATFFQPQEEDAQYEALLADREAWDRSFEEVVGSYLNAPGANQTNGWGVLNAVTHWADHVSGRGGEARLNSTWLGKNAGLKIKVRDKLLEMAQ